MEEVDKKELSERDICSKFITPAIKLASWDERQIREEVNLTRGMIIVKGSAASRGKPKRTDYILSYKPNIPLAVVEAKRNIYTVGEGMQQALTYAEMLDIPFAFSSNGDAFLDGFLAPYRVIRIDLDKDLAGWRPEKDKIDKYGKPIEDRIYNQKDFDRDLVLEKRTELVAKKVTEFLKENDRFDKTIVFCENIDHAERMREALVNENPDFAGENRKYVMRITGDNQEGKAELDNFINPESRYPVIATTSKLMSTGVDAQTCKLIVLDKRIQSMTEFKQIIGRGTRINEDYGKFYFTIMDFKKATELFADPDFDGEPVEIYGPGGDGPGDPRDTEGETGREKYFVDDVDVDVVTERTQYYGPDGKLITESLKDYTRKTVLKDFESLDSFLKHWNEAEKKQAILAELEERGVLLDALSKEVGKDFDPFDRIGTPMEIVKLFGGKSSYLAAVRGLESQLYTLEAELLEA